MLGQYERNQFISLLKMPKRKKRKKRKKNEKENISTKHNEEAIKGRTFKSEVLQLDL